MAAYSQDLRDRVLRALARGEGATSIAQRLEVSLRWVYHVKDRYECHGERGARRLGGYRRSRLADFEARIRGWLAEQVDLTLAELCARLAQHGVSIKTTALWRQLNHWGLTFKKNSARPRARARRRAGRAPGLASQPAHAGGEQAGVPG
jgi:transposase